jgi:hypothetical protein
MKTVTVTATQPELRKLVEEAYAGAHVILAYGDKKVKLERYAPSGGPVDFDLDQDSSELEAELLKGVQGPFSPYSRRDLDVIAKRCRREKAGS